MEIEPQAGVAYRQDGGWLLVPLGTMQPAAKIDTTLTIKAALGAGPPSAMPILVTFQATGGCLTGLRISATTAALHEVSIYQSWNASSH